MEGAPAIPMAEASLVEDVHLIKVLGEDRAWAEDDTWRLSAKETTGFELLRRKDMFLQWECLYPEKNEPKIGYYVSR